MTTFEKTGPGHPVAEIGANLAILFSTTRNRLKSLGAFPEGMLTDEQLYDPLMAVSKLVQRGSDVPTTRPATEKIALPQTLDPYIDFRPQ